MSSLIEQECRNLSAWIRSYDPEGKTYQQFWTEYNAALQPLFALESGGVSDDDRLWIKETEELPYLLGYDFKRLDP